MQPLQSMALGLFRAATWPLYLILLAYTSRVGPWPRSLGILVSAVLTGWAIAIFVHDVLRWLTGPSGWPDRNLGVPRAVMRQLGSTGRFVVAIAVALLLPVYLFDHELIAPEGKPITAPALSRLLVLAFELLVWCACVRLLRGYSPLLEWLSVPQADPATINGVKPAGADTLPAAELTTIPDADSDSSPQPFSVSGWCYSGLLWLGRRRRLIAAIVLAAMAGIIVLDVRGYSFTARRLATGGSQTIVVIALAAAAYRTLVQEIGKNARRLVLPRRSWAMALTSAIALRSKIRLRGAIVGPVSAPSASNAEIADDDGETALDDLAAGLRRLAAYSITGLTVLALAWIWEVDMALMQFLLNKPLWAADAQTAVTVGNVAEASLVVLIGALSWRYMNTLFALTIFPKMPDDPGVRFAVVTLCRYAVLGLTSLIALGAIHLDLAKVGVVLAALGVGLGFGLQEIVSNFVCGIILLLERPIRIGDVVTVAGTTGKVDRINIRATTIINSDNQSMIVPNREFITGNLVNWTLKDKILRVPIKLNVAYGSDPDRVVDLLLQVARADADVMINPAPSAAPRGVRRIGPACRTLRVRSRTRSGRHRAASPLCRDPAPIQPGWYCHSLPNTGASRQQSSWQRAPGCVRTRTRRRCHACALSLRRRQEGFPCASRRQYHHVNRHKSQTISKRTSGADDLSFPAGKPSSEPGLSNGTRTQARWLNAPTRALFREHGSQEPMDL